MEKYTGLYLEVWDWDRVGSDDFMGCKTYFFSDLPQMNSLSSSLTSSKRTEVLKLEKHEGKYKSESVSGSITLEIELKLLVDANASLMEGSFLNVKSVGLSMKNEGWKPKHPIIIIPGIYSSALEVWQGADSLFGKRIWVTIQGMGSFSPPPFFSCHHHHHHRQ